LNDTVWGLAGVDWAMMGAAIGAILGGIGSAIGITYASSTVAGILSADDTKFGQLLPIAAMPGTQGIYGFITAVLVLIFFNLLDGTGQVEAHTGVQIFFACLPVGFICLFSGIYQGRTGMASAGIIAADKQAPALIFPALVETYAVLALIVTILMLISIQASVG
jgi:V/A-type H+-transporting ATPase subunit K